MEKLASEVEKTTKLSSQLHDDDKNQEQVSHWPAAGPCFV